MDLRLKYKHATRGGRISADKNDIEILHSNL